MGLRYDLPAVDKLDGGVTELDLGEIFPLCSADGPTGGKQAYTLSRPQAKKLIPVDLSPERLATRSRQPLPVASEIEFTYETH